jgi:hypothetical protein
LCETEIWILSVFLFTIFVLIHLWLIKSFVIAFAYGHTTHWENYISFRVRLGLRFQKVLFKITILKCAIWKKWFLKTQLSVWQNRSLAFKIANSKNHHLICNLKKQIFCVFKSQFLKTQFPNDLCSVIWFKIALIVYEIAISNAPLVFFSVNVLCYLPRNCDLLHKKMFVMLYWLMQSELVVHRLNKHTQVTTLQQNQ